MKRFNGDEKDESDKRKIITETDDDNITMYGEFITSYFAWLPLDKQKEKAKEMGKMTKKIR